MVSTTGDLQSGTADPRSSGSPQVPRCRVDDGLQGFELGGADGTDVQLSNVLRCACEAWFCVKTFGITINHVNVSQVIGDPQNGCFFHSK